MSTLRWNSEAVKLAGEALRAALDTYENSDALPFSGGGEEPSISEAASTYCGNLDTMWTELTQSLDGMADTIGDSLVTLEDIDAQNEQAFAAILAKRG